jgi:DNA-binding XRE family transcriptional regulator
MAKRAPPSAPFPSRLNRVGVAARAAKAASRGIAATPDIQGTKGDRAKSPSKLKGKADGAPVELQVIFGENLKAARLKCGFKQSDMAERTGLPQQYLSQIELGQQNITLKTMELLAKVVERDASSMIRRIIDVPRKK